MSLTNRRIFVEVFTIDGVDKEEKTFNGVLHDIPDSDDYITAVSEVSGFSFHHLSLFAAFLGLPHRLLAPSQQQSLLNLAKNFCGWRDTVSLWKNILTVPFMTLMNIVITPFKLFFNLLKIFTEFLPMLAAERLTDLSTFTQEAADHADSFPKFALYHLGVGIALIGVYAARVLVVVGQQITSPNYAIRRAFRAGFYLGSQLGPGFGIVAGVCIGAISFMNTLTFYLLFMPIGLKFVAAKLPAAVTSALNNVGSVLEPFLKYLAEAAIDYSWIEAPYSAGLALAGITGLSTMALGKVARLLSNKFKVWWHAPEVQPAMNQNELHADVNPQPAPAPLYVHSHQQMQAFHISAPPPAPSAPVPSAPSLGALHAVSLFQPASVNTELNSNPQSAPNQLSI